MQQRIYDTRPWGNFIQFTTNEPSTVKILTIKPHESTSLQYHKLRQEFWKVLKGSPIVIIGSAKVLASEGQEFFIQKGFKHRIEARDTEVQILEISFGTFDEQDIVRLEDKYLRNRFSFLVESK